MICCGNIMKVSLFPQLVWVVLCQRITGITGRKVMMLYKGRWSRPLKTLPLSLEIDFTVSFSGTQSPNNTKSISILSVLPKKQILNLFQQQIAITLDQSFSRIENFINNLAGLENLNQTTQSQPSQNHERN